MSAGSQLEAPRILLVERHEQRRAARAKMLLSLGYRVSALANSDAAPRSFPQHLYDAIVLSADDAAVPLHWCERMKRSGAKPLLIVLADAMFPMDAKCLPAMVIAEPSPKAAEEKLLAFLASVTQDCAAGG